MNVACFVEDDDRQQKMTEKENARERTIQVVYTRLTHPRFVEPTAEKRTIEGTSEDEAEAGRYSNAIQHHLHPHKPRRSFFRLRQRCGHSHNPSPPARPLCSYPVKQSSEIPTNPRPATHNVPEHGLSRFLLAAAVAAAAAFDGAYPFIRRCLFRIFNKIIVVVHCKRKREERERLFDVLCVYREQSHLLLASD